MPNSAELEIAELNRLLKIAEYERDFLQERLDAIRANKERLISLLDSPTPQEAFDRGDGIEAIFGVSPDLLIVDEVIGDA